MKKNFIKFFVFAFLGAILVLNVTILNRNNEDTFSLFKLSIKQASAEHYPTDGDIMDQGCEICGEGTARYYCIGGANHGCFDSGGCVGGLCY
ncbi:MAG: hypothetical protein K9H26_19525 [Prolixibacteraceae bacterium]|nr:hypothetical protein [Prolixibacteraceae bacterium]